VDRIFLGQAIFLRHGESDYTDVFPDLTDEGRKTIQRSAVEIEKIRSDFTDNGTSIVSSPAARAQGSAAIIAKRFGIKRVGRIPLLKPTQIRDEEKGKAIYLKYVSDGGMRSLCVAYGKDSRFEDGVIFEPRSEVSARLCKYLAMLAECMFVVQLPHLVVAVSHYEVLCHFVEELFKLDYARSDPLRHGELIRVFFNRAENNNAVNLDVIFRETRVKALFDIRQKRLLIAPA